MGSYKLNKPKDLKDILDKINENLKKATGRNSSISFLRNYEEKMQKFTENENSKTNFCLNIK